jgi:methyltransferase (TIGR00027 family)
VQNEKASRTALLIGASLVLLHHDPRHSTLVSSASAELCGEMLEMHSSQTRLFAKLVRRGWFRLFAKSIERITIPGMLLHYSLRKKCISKLVRSALSSGATQVVVIGAGFDPLTFELQRDFVDARFWEIDHPATQCHKLRALSKLGAPRLRFLAMDLGATGFDTEALINSGFDPAQRTFWIAEGLLMYLPGDLVTSLMETLSTLSARGSQFVFTFMEKRSDGRIRFDSQSKLVDWWLRRRGEPFLWGTTRCELVDHTQPWRISRILDHDDLRQIESGLTADQRIARGEIICLAEI